MNERRAQRIKQLNQMLEQSPNEPFLLFALGQEYKNEGNLEQAIFYFEKIYTNTKKYTGVYYHLAETLIKQKAPDQRIKEVYEKGLTICKQENDRHALSELNNAYQNWQLGID